MNPQTPLPTDIHSLSMHWDPKSRGVALAPVRQWVFTLMQACRDAFDEVLQGLEPELQGSLGLPRAGDDYSDTGSYYAFRCPKRHLRDANDY
jgi:hypothetical protein